MKRSIIDDSRDFWIEIVLPLLQSHFPEESRHMAAGFFGYGSEVLRLDDQYSTDHHFGLRVNILLPEALKTARGAAIDLRPTTNGNRMHWPTASDMPIEVMEIFAVEGWLSAGAFWNRDSMHFQSTK